MRLAVLSDIHGNLAALEAVVAALAPFDAVWQLGDIVGYGPQPDEVIERLRVLGAGGVRGNHDAAALRRLDVSLFNDDARAAIEWTAGALGADGQRYLQQLPDRTVDNDFTLVHGSPRDPTWEYVYSTPVAQACFPAFDTTHCLVGHTHVPLVFREDDGRVETLAPSDGSRLVLDRRRTILNPGSVGQPRDGDRRASGMVIDTERRTVEWRRVEYEIGATQERMRALGLPARLVERLAHGL